jgi:hypothetical protein
VISNLVKKVNKFNLINKNKIKLPILRLTDGEIRLDFGNQKKEEIRFKNSNISLTKKNALMDKLFLQFSLFNDFLNKNI